MSRCALPARFPRRLGLLLGLGLTLLPLPALRAQDPGSSDEAPMLQDEEDFEALLESLQDLSPVRRVMALEAHLERYPGSPHRAEIEQRIDDALEAERRGNTRHLLSWEALPLRLEPGLRPEGARVSLALDLPSRARLVLFYDRPLVGPLDFSAGLELQNGTTAVEARGRYRLWESARHHQQLIPQLALRAELGQDSRLAVVPRVVYARNMDNFLVTGALGAYLRTDLLELQGHGGLSLVWSPNRRTQLGLEVEGYVEREEADRPDLPTLTREWVAFVVSTAGARFQVHDRIILGATLGLPVYRRYQQPFSIQAMLQAEVRLGETPETAKERENER